MAMAEQKPPGTCPHCGKTPGEYVDCCLAYGDQAPSTASELQVARLANELGEVELAQLRADLARVSSERDQAWKWIDDEAQHTDRCDLTNYGAKKPCNCGLSTLLDRIRKVLGDPEPQPPGYDISADATARYNATKERFRKATGEA